MSQRHDFQGEWYGVFENSEESNEGHLVYLPEENASVKLITLKSFDYSTDHDFVVGRIEKRHIALSKMRFMVTKKLNGDKIHYQEIDLITHDPVLVYEQPSSIVARGMNPFTHEKFSKIRFQLHRLDDIRSKGLEILHAEGNEYSIKLIPPDKDAPFTQTSYFEITLRDSQKLEDVLDTINSVRTLVSLLWGQLRPIEWIELETTENLQVDVLLNTDNKTPDVPQLTLPVFAYGGIKLTEFQEMFNGWWALSKRHTSYKNALKTNSFSYIAFNVRLTALTSAIEQIPVEIPPDAGFSKKEIAKIRKIALDALKSSPEVSCDQTDWVERRLASTPLPLHKRLLAIIENLDDASKSILGIDVYPESVDQVVRLISKARNQQSHQAHISAVSSDHIADLVAVVKAIFILNTLKQLGIPPEIIYHVSIMNLSLNVKQNYYRLVKITKP